MKNILVSFSGGLDSTYLVYKNLKEGNKVKLCFSIIENNTNKTIVEKFCARKLYEEFLKEFPQQIQSSFDFNTKVLINDYVGGLKFKQILIWLFSLIYHCEKETDKVHIGITLNDDINPYRKDIKRIWKSFKPFYNGKLPKIKFPIYKKQKYEIEEDLPTNYKKFITFCENPHIIYEDNLEVKFENCGECDSCRRYNYLNMIHIGYGQINSNFKTLEEPLNEKIDNNQLSLNF